MIAPPASYPLVADILSESLAVVFENLCAQRYGGPLSIRRPTTPEDNPATVHFVLERSDVSSVEATFTIRHVGGNMYDLMGVIDGGPIQLFSYCLPDATVPPLPPAPHLSQKVATFLLDALERRLGSDLLRQRLRHGSSQQKKGARQASSPAHAPSVV